LVPHIPPKMLPVIVATLAPFISCIQLMPQMYKTYTTKNVKDLSFVTLLMILCADTLWLLHGHFIVDYSLIIGCLINVVIVFALLIMYCLYK